MMTGRTIAEIQATITISEHAIWVAYRKKYGPMNPVRRYDSGPAIVASILSRVNGGKSAPKDFMPYSIEEDKEVSGDEFVNALAQAGGVKIGQRR